jgi:hypothetical protein
MYIGPFDVSQMVTCRVARPLCEHGYRTLGSFRNVQTHVVLVHSMIHTLGATEGKFR